jgi:2-polyprenyl-6-methoxyphenol hydroxylase-like FAD-dependent oxidoreductase
MRELSSDYDVAIVGAGLAGLTLALQLQQDSPGLSIAVLERDSLPPPIAAHKVGESTVEIGAHYLAHTLGFDQLLDDTQLRKFGLRLFFGSGMHSDLSKADELGPSRLLPALSYQIDRGKLEADLAEILQQRGISLHDNCVVKQAKINANGAGHEIKLTSKGQQGSLHCRWLVDASSRAAVVKRGLNMNKSCDHKINSAWFRLDAPISVDNWSKSESWQQQCNRPRLYSTNHLMGCGYWVWIIPLAGNKTSVGLVADPEVHPLSSFGNFEKFTQWLSQHQPMLADEVIGARDTLMDFKFAKSLSQDSDQVWSRERWALTGEAGVFADPFYSPGSDFIGISNTFIADMIRRDRLGGRFATHAAVYEKMYMSFLESTMSLYENQYAGFGDTRLMVVKTTWDYAYYWSILSWLFFRKVMTDLNFLRIAQPRLREIRALNSAMQAAFRQRAAERIVDEGRGRFIDQSGIPVLYDLNAALLQTPSSVESELNDNCDRLVGLAPILLSVLEGGAADGQGSCSLLGDLRRRLN